VRAYFDTVGWPTIVNESERKPFAMQVNYQCRPPDNIDMTVVNIMMAVGYQMYIECGLKVSPHHLPSGG
jgi:hypothetical protein